MPLLEKIKNSLKLGVIYGLIFAGGFYIYDAFNDKPFDLNKFVFNFIIFTILMVVKEIYLINKREKNNNGTK
ncbi:hypothetical protein [Lacinutrix jangbogonensis]|uniref:hypothetical protein n=1 Tax=Lacinutrix jangbogonensis TaxID=1469557 RepID=UPI00053F23BC|nr:hypothetical protein [Lacinutrix jangbogonensis]